MISITIQEIAQPGEEFKEITDFIIEGVEPHRYYVSNFGRVFDVVADKIKGVDGVYNYKSVGIVANGKMRPWEVHRLVMMLFGGPIWYADLDVNHIDGIKTNNNRENLEWCTRSYNIKHAYETGLHPRGVDVAYSKIKDENIVIQICELLQEGKYLNREIAEIVGNGVTVHMVDDIKKKSCWKHISKDYNFYQRPGRKFDEELVEQVCQYFQNNPKPDSITVNDHCRNALSYLGINFDEKWIDCLRKVYIRKYYTHISSKYKF